MVRQAIEQGGCHFGVAEDARPFREAEIGGDDDAGALVELAEEVEQQGAARSTERQISRNAQRRMTLSNAMSITPCPPPFAAGEGSNMGQISVENFSQPGSGFGGNQQSVIALSCRSTSRPHFDEDSLWSPKNFAAWRRSMESLDCARS